MPGHIRGITLSALLALLLVACGGGSSSGGVEPRPPVTRVTYEYAVPEDKGDGWTVSSLADQGFDTAKILDMMDRIVNEDYPGIDSIAIARNNTLVLYWWTGRRLDEFDAWIGNVDPERHVLHSSSKSVTSALVGIAIDQGHIASTDVGFYDLFSFSSYDNWDARKANMTLEDALTMRFGLEWDEWSLPYTDPNNDLVALNRDNLNWPKALLDLPLVNDPGTVFTYNTAGTNAIGQAVQNAVGQPLAEFANEFLFYPMQITDAEWARTPSDLPVGGSGLFLRTRDFAKFGQLYLDNGVWQGQQLISADWIADTVVRRVDISSWATYSVAYGFQWWLDDLDYQGTPVEAWVTSGYGGQYLFVVPSLELVVAFTGQNYENAAGIANLYTMMQAFVFEAIN